MISTVQCPTLNRSFWKELPASELSATITANLRDYVGFEEIVEACKRSDELVVVECGEATVVGVDTSELVMPDNASSAEDFVDAHSDYWVIIPEEGSPVDYVEDQLCASETVFLPRLVELEKGRESDNAGLLFGITNALRLPRASFDPVACVVTYF